MRRWLCLVLLSWPAVAAASADAVHRLLVADRFDEARRLALADLAAAGRDLSSRAQRLDALRALLDGAIAARDVAPAEVGDWAAEVLAGDGAGAAPSGLRAQALAVQAARARRGDAAARDAVLAQALDLAPARGAAAAYVYQVQAMILVDGSHFAEACAAIERARAALDRPRDDWERLRRATLEVLYGAYAERAGRDDALTVAQRGVAGLRGVAGARSLHHAFGLTYLGQLRYFRGDYLGAARDAGAAVAILADRPERAMDRGAARMIQANALRTLGDYDGAHAAYADAIALARHDPLDANLSGRLNGLGVLEQWQGDRAAARATFLQALALIEHPDEDRRAIPVLGNLGQMALEDGDLERAQELIERSLRLSLRLYGADHATVLDQRLSLGLLALRRGEVVRARDRLADVVRAQHDRYGEDYPPLQQARCALALAQARAGNPDAAWGLALAAERQRVALLRRVVPVLAAGPALAFKRHLPACDGVLLALAVRAPSAARLQSAWGAAAAARGLATRLQAQRLAIVRARADAPAQAAWQRWESAARAYADALLFQAEARALGRARQTLDDAEAALGETARGALQALVPPPDAVEPRADGGPLVAFVEAAAVDLQAASADPWPAARRLYAFVRDAAGVRLLDLGDATARAAEVGRWERALRAPQSPAQELADAGRAVRAALWDPLHLADDARLGWIPDGAAFRVNPLALPDGDAYLAERGLVVAVHDAERDAAPVAPAAPRGRLLLVGAPDFGAAPPACAAGLAPLPGAVAELRAVAARWPGAVTVLDGGGVRKDALRRELGRADALHLATHLVPIGEDCPSFAAARGARLVAEAAPNPAAQGNQLALALAGANRYYARRDASVLLSVPEILALPLQRLRFVVLAACDSGSGPVQPEEGVFGLRRAFRLAGAGAVVMSLWAVDDRASADWMERFYAALGQGQDLAPAAAQAARGELQRRRRDGASTHPYYWAAYLVVEPRR